jgi:hypothetical protein
MPAIYPLRTFADLGGLMSYGSSVLDLNRRAGIYVGKILNGAKPADLPVQQSTKLAAMCRASPSLLCAGAKDITAKPTLLTPPAGMFTCDPTS